MSFTCKCIEGTYVISEADVDFVHFGVPLPFHYFTPLGRGCTFICHISGVVVL